VYDDSACAWPLDAVVRKRAAEELKMRNTYVKVGCMLHVKFLKCLPLHHSQHDQTCSPVEAKGGKRKRVVALFETVLHGEHGAAIVYATAVSEFFLCQWQGGRSRLLWK